MSLEKLIRTALKKGSPNPSSPNPKLVQPFRSPPCFGFSDLRIYRRSKEEGKAPEWSEEQKKHLEVCPYCPKLLQHIDAEGTQNISPIPSEMDERIAPNLVDNQPFPKKRPHRVEIHLPTILRWFLVFSLVLVVGIVFLKGIHQPSHPKDQPIVQQVPTRLAITQTEREVIGLGSKSQPEQHIFLTLIHPPDGFVTILQFVGDRVDVLPKEDQYCLKLESQSQSTVELEEPIRKPAQQTKRRLVLVTDKPVATFFTAKMENDPFPVPLTNNEESLVAEIQKLLESNGISFISYGWVEIRPTLP
jgi:hypothetical protein